MPDTTEFLGLEKPSKDEAADIDVLNRNADKLDAFSKTVALKQIILTDTLPATSWVASSNGGYELTTTLVGILSTDVPFMDIEYIGTTVDEKVAESEAYGFIGEVEALDGQVKYVCLEDKPTVDIRVRLAVSR